MRTLLAILVVAAAFGTAFPQAASAQLSCMVLPEGADDNATGPIKCFRTVDDCLASGGGSNIECVCDPDERCAGKPDGSAPSDAAPSTGLLNEAEQEGAAGSNRPEPTKLDNPLGAGTTLPILIGRVTRMLMGISGSLALVLFVYGGFLWLTSAGNMDKVKQGKKLFVSATLGLIVIFSAYVLVAQVFTILGL